MAGYSFAKNFREPRAVRGDFEPTLTRREHFRLMLLQAIRYGDKTPNEHPGVPAILATVHVAQRGFKVWFLDELLGFEERRLGFLRAGRRGQFVSGADVAVARGGFGGLDADGDDDLPLGRDIERIAQHLLKLFFLRDDVIRITKGGFILSEMAESCSR